MIVDLAWVHTSLRLPEGNRLQYLEAVGGAKYESAFD